MNTIHLSATLLATALTFACSTPREDAARTPNDNTTASGGAMPPADAPTSRAAETHTETHAASHADVSGQPYELRFFDTMAMHHKSAVEMAKMAETQAMHPELKQLAAKMHKDQDKEIAEMRAHREQHYAGKPEAMDHSMPGMTSMPPMDMSKLKAAQGADFDREFIAMMIPHHQAAVMMSEDAMSKSTMPMVKQMADKMAAAQKQEIEQLKSWQASWFGKNSKH